MTKYIPVVAAAFMAVLFTTGIVSADHGKTGVNVVSSGPPDRCYTVQEMEEGKGENVIMIEHSLESTIALVRHYVPREFEPIFPKPSEVKGSLVSFKESMPYFVFALVDKDGCLMHPLLAIEGAPPGYTGQDA